MPNLSSAESLHNAGSIHSNTSVIGEEKINIFKPISSFGQAHHIEIIFLPFRHGEVTYFAVGERQYLGPGGEVTELNKLPASVRIELISSELAALPTKWLQNKSKSPENHSAVIFVDISSISQPKGKRLTFLLSSPLLSFPFYLHCSPNCQTQVNPLQSAVLSTA